MVTSRSRCLPVLLAAGTVLSCRREEKPPEPRADVAADAAPPAGTLVVMLGTGTPRPDPERSGPATAVVAGGQAYVVDCGAGVVRRAAAAALAGVRPLDPRRLTRLFITHLHSDHTLGYADLILTPWTIGRKESLEVYGPPGLRAMTDHLLAAYAEDIGVRVDGLEQSDPEGCRVAVHEVEPGEAYRDANVRVVVFEVKHGSWPAAYGYRFEASDRTIVISGDTGPGDATAEACRGCDVLVHEVFARRGFGDLPDDWRAYHSSFHTSTTELARIAAAANPGLLVLYHQLLWGGETDDRILVDEIARRWNGRVVSGKDLDVF